ncbi:MAG: carbohydrate ABC transporter substrate-binding protein [Blautia sp.]|nr:carbohydrate ABC transporter substrate-binding protein [Blautia sp.]
MKKAVSMMLAAAMAVAMIPAIPAQAADVSITIFNSKMEIQSQMEEMAAEYSAEKGVDVEVYYSSDTVAAHMSTRYASNEPYTISMVDAKDIYSLGPDHAVDLADQDWVKETTQAITVGDAVYGFPVCVEARGIIYNKTAIEDTLGEEFNPEDYKTNEAFAGLLDALKENGMDAPVGVMKEDWSLAGHFIAEVYETRDDVDGFVASLHDGSSDLINDERFNTMLDTFDLLKENNYAADAPVAAVREDTELYLAEGEVAFMFGGNWDWSVLAEYDPEAEMGMMPIPQDDDAYNTKMVGGGSKYFFIDNSDNTTDEQREAAKDFLNWLVFEDGGQEFLVDTCALVPAFSNIELEVTDPLGKSVKAYADADALIGNYNYLPDDHYAKVGANMQEYLKGDIDRETLAADIEAYWQATAPVEH